VNNRSPERLCPNPRARPVITPAGSIVAIIVAANRKRALAKLASGLRTSSVVTCQECQSLAASAGTWQSGRVFASKIVAC
jgi:hypothetical protein